jgi:thymidylate synthase
MPSLQIMKEPPPLESSIDEKLKWIGELQYDDFILENYKSHESIKAVMK